MDFSICSSIATSISSLVGRDDIATPARTFPAGRLREPLDTLVAADAVLAADDDVDHGARSGVDRSVLSRHPARRSRAGRDAPAPCLPWPASRSPDRFFRRSARCRDASLAGTLRVSRSSSVFATRRRSAWLRRRAQRARAAIVTTEKDYVRLLPFRPFPMPIACAPLTMEPDPPIEFRAWLAGSMRAARDIVD